MILCTGELLPNKNQETIIRAMLEVRKKYNNIYLLLAGNGTLKNHLENISKECGVEDRIRFLGYRTDLNRYVNASDLIVSCSFREGLPLNIMEAMACQKSLVVSRNRGHCELVKDSYNGFLVEPKNFELFANAIIRLYENDDMRIQMANNSFSLSEKYLDKNVLMELKDFY